MAPDNCTIQKLPAQLTEAIRVLKPFSFSLVLFWSVSRKTILINKPGIVNYTRYKRKQSPAKSTIDFLGFWEKSNNPDFKPIEFDRFKKEAGNNY